MTDPTLKHPTNPGATVDAIASTVAPGLVGCLRVGSVTARTLCTLHSKPFLGIHHLEGHLSSVLFLKNFPKRNQNKRNS